MIKQQDKQLLTVTIDLHVLYQLLELHYKTTNNKLQHYHTAAQLGQCLGWNTRRFNNQLTIEGYQYCNEERLWMPTNKGRRFSLSMDEQLLWHDSILNDMLLEDA